jgi:hypothetical protein
MEYLKAVVTYLGLAPYMGLLYGLPYLKLEAILDRISIDALGYLVVLLTVVLGLWFHSLWPLVLPALCAAGAFAFQMFT